MLPLTNMYDVAVVGVGGIGSWVAYFLTVSNRVKNIHIYDDDTVDETNLNRTPYLRDDIGKPKVYALYRILTALGRDTNIKIYKKKVEDTLDEDVEVIIDCRDVVDDFSKKSNIVVGYDGTEMTVHIHPNGDSVFSSDEHRGYYVPSYVVPPVIGAALIVEYVLSDKVVPINDERVVNIDIHNFVQNMFGMTEKGYEQGIVYKKTK